MPENPAEIVSSALTKGRKKWNRASSEASSAPQQMAVPTPIIISHRVRLLIIVAIVLFLAYMVRSLPTIMSIVLLGATLSLILSFPVRLLQKFLSRRVSIAVVTITLFGSTIIGLVLIIPFLVNEITQFVNALPETTEAVTDQVYAILESMHNRGWLEDEPDQIIEDLRAGLLDSSQSIATTVADNVLVTLTSSVALLISAFGMVFVAVYMLADIPTFRNTYMRLWAPAYRVDAQVLWDTLGYSLSRFLSAQLLSLFIQGTITFIGLYFLGVPYALILGLVQAVAAILPYIGAFIAAAPAILMALTIGWQTAVGVAIFYLLLNQLEGNLITPNLQGNAVKVHPILIFLGVIGGSQLFGIIGAVLAVPAIAILRVIFEFFWVRLRVQDDIPTVLAMMRNDTANERQAYQSGAADQVQDDANRPMVAQQHQPD